MATHTAHTLFLSVFPAYGTASVKERGTAELTNARAIQFLVANAADASSQRNQPVPVGAAEQLGRVPFFSVLDTRPPHLHQRGGVHPRHRVRKRRQVPQREGTLLVINPHRDQSDAGANVLEGQVEALPGHGSHLPHLGVELQDSIAQIHLGEALVGRDGVDLGVLHGPEFYTVSLVGLVVEEVEGLLARARHPGDGVAVAQGEAQLHVDLLGGLSRNPVRTQPVVLIGLHHVAHLERVDGAVVLIHLCDGIPLKRRNEKARR